LCFKIKGTENNWALHTGQVYLSSLIGIAMFVSKYTVYNMKGG